MRKQKKSILFSPAEIVHDKSQLGFYIYICYALAWGRVCKKILTLQNFPNDNFTKGFFDPLDQWSPNFLKSDPNFNKKIF